MANLTKVQKRLLPCTIYLLTHINGKLYVGRTTYDLAKYVSSIQTLSNRHQLCREDFQKTELEKCENAEIGAKREAYWIKYYDSYNTLVGYNKTPNGDGGNASYGGKNRIHTKDSKNKMSNSMKKSKKFKIFSDSCKKKISIDDVKYDSMLEAASILEIPYTTISSRLNSKTFTNYKRL